MKPGIYYSPSHDEILLCEEYQQPVNSFSPLGFYTITKLLVTDSKSVGFYFISDVEESFKKYHVKYIGEFEE